MDRDAKSSAEGRRICVMARDENGVGYGGTRRGGLFTVLRFHTRLLRDARVSPKRRHGASRGWRRSANDSGDCGSAFRVDANETTRGAREWRQFYEYS